MSARVPGGGSPGVRRRSWWAVAAACATLAIAACAGPPWFLGAPLDGRPAIPPRSRALTVAEHRRAADTAHATNNRLDELTELLALEERGALRPAEERRLLDLLVLRTHDWGALKRPIPLAEDLRHIAALAPGRAYLLGRRLRAAEIAAGDEWLAIGENGRAEAEYRRAEKLGSQNMDFRFRAVWGASVTDLDLPTIERAMSALPARVLAPFTRQYLDRSPALKPRPAIEEGPSEGPSNPPRDGGGELGSPAPTRLLRRGWEAARVYGPADLLARIDALPAAGRFRDEELSKAVTEPKANDRGAVWAVEAAEAVKIESARVTAIEPAADDALSGGLTLARALIPAAAAFPQILDPSPRSRAWAERLLAEDPSSPDSLEIAALIEARAARWGGAARRLKDLVFFSSDRAAGYGRAARVWERAGRPREACAAWEHATRVGATDDPRWCDLLACVKREPGAGDAAAIAAHIRERAPTLACAGMPAAEGGSGGTGSAGAARGNDRGSADGGVRVDGGPPDARGESPPAPLPAAGPPPGGW